MESLKRKKKQLPAEPQRIFEQLEKLQLAKDEIENKFNIIFDNAPLAIFIEDLDGNVTDCNQAAVRMTGYDKTDLLRMNARDLVLEEVARMFPNLIESLQEGGSYFTETFNVRRNGEIFPVEVCIRLFELKKKQLLLVMIRDLTDHKRREKFQAATYKISEAATATRNLDELFRSIHAIIGELMPARNFYIAMHRADSQTIHFPYFVDEYDVPPPPRQEGKGLTEYVIRTGLSLLANRETFAELEELGEIEPIGQPAVSWLGTPLKTEDRIIGALVVQSYTESQNYGEEEKSILAFVSEQVAMVIERKQAEEALAEEKERLAVTLRSIGDGVITTYTDGSIMLLNRAAEDLTGWQEAQAVGKPLTEVFRILDAKTRKAADNPVEKVVCGACVHTIGEHTLLVKRDGSERLISDSAAPIRDRESKIIGVVLVFRDITEKQKHEDERSRTQKIESLGILAGGIAHDFNNILTAILGNIALVKMSLKPEDKQYERLNESEKAALRARDLTQELLTFSKGGEPIRRTTAISDLIREATQFALRGSNVTYNILMAENLWPVSIDEGQIRRAIHNIVTNADQAMLGGGSIEIVVENVLAENEKVKTLPPGKFVKITITDHGIGIPPENLPKIFDPYFTTKTIASGLGLATAYSVLKKHHGHIHATSKVGAGSSFSVYLPVSEGPVEAVAAHPEFAPVLGRERKKILLMDDEEIIIDVAGEMLNLLGYDLAVARDGVEALALYTEALEAGQPFAAIIMDLTIPGGMGGRETIKKILEIHPQAKAIVSSGYSNDPVMANYRQYGFLGIMHKPYRIEVLNKILEDVLLQE